MVGDLEPPDLIADQTDVAWLGRAVRPGEAWVTALGERPDVLAGLVEQLAAQHRIDGVTVPEVAFDALPPPLRSPDPGHWCLWTLDPRDVEPRPTSAVDVALDDPRIGPLLAYSDSAHVFPGNPGLVRWAGVVEDSRLLSVAGQVSESSGAAHIVSVCTDPEVRGRGLARDACRLLIDHAVADQAPMIVLEMYTANDAGRRTYSALGFREVGRYRSGLLSRPEDRDDPA